MSRKIILTLGIVCAIAVTMVHAQVVQGTNPAGITTEVKGSPYLDESYVDGVILFANNTRTAQVRYNAWKDLIEFKQENGQARVLDPANTIKRVQFGQTTFVVEKYDADGTERFGYFSRLDSGKVSLYAKKVMKFTPAMKARALDGGDQPAEFRRAPDEFYLKIADGTLTEIKNIKSLVAALPDKKEEVSAFAKKQKISPRDEKELTALIQYYNSL
jgi:hypothetical protein